MPATLCGGLITITRTITINASHIMWGLDNDNEDEDDNEDDNDNDVGGHDKEKTTH